MICVCLDSLFLYKAFKRSAQFKVYTEIVGLGIEAGADVHRFEVWVIRAVTPAGDGYELAVEDLRIALASIRTYGLYEGVVVLLVMSEQTSISLVELCEDVVAENGFYIHADVRITVPTLLLIIYAVGGVVVVIFFDITFVFPGMPSVSHEGPSVQQGK